MGKTREGRSTEWHHLPIHLLTAYFLLLTCSDCTGRSDSPYALDETEKSRILQTIKDRHSVSADSEPSKPSSSTSAGSHSESMVRASTDPVRTTPSVSFKGNDVPLRLVLDRVAMQADWKIRWGAEVEPDRAVTVEIIDVPFHIAVMDAVSPLGYTATFDFAARVATVERFVERIFYLPEIWARRQRPMPAAPQGGVFMRYAEDPAVAVENAIRAFLSSSGKILVDPIAGTVLVRDEHRNMKVLERYFRQLDEEARSPWKVDVAILIASPPHSGIEWDKISERVGITPLGNGSPTGLIQNSTGTEADPVNALLKALEPVGARLLSRPQAVTLNGWTLQMAIGAGAETEGVGWELSLTVHRDFDREGFVVLEAAGGLADKVAQSFSTTARAEIGQPLVVSTGVGSSVEKRWFGDRKHTQEAVFMIRVLRAPFSAP